MQCRLRLFSNRFVTKHSARAGIIAADKPKADSLLDFPWSSIARGYALPPTKHLGMNRATGQASYLQFQSRSNTLEHGLATAATCCLRSGPSSDLSIKRIHHPHAHTFTIKIRSISRHYGQPELLGGRGDEAVDYR